MRKLAFLDYPSKGCARTIERRTRSATEVTPRKWSAIDVSFLGNYPKLAREIEHDEEAVLG